MLRTIRPLILIALLLATPVLAQPEQNSKPAAEEISAQSVNARLTKARALTVRSETWLSTAEPAQLAGLRQQLALSRKLEVAYRGQLTALNRNEALRQDLALQQSILAGDFRRQLPQPPYNLSEYDRLLDELDAGTQQQKTARTALAIETSAIDENLALIARLKQELRALKDAGSATESVELSLELAEANLARHKLVKANAQLELELAETKSELATRKLDWARERLAYDAADLNAQLRNLADRRAALLSQQEALSESLARLENEWRPVQQQLEAGGQDALLAEALLKEFEFKRQARQKQLEQIESRLQFLNQIELIWQHRYALLKQRPPLATLQQWIKEQAVLVSSLDRQFELVLSEQKALQPQMASLSQDLNLANQSGAVKTHRENALMALNEQINRGIEYLTALKATQTLAQRYGAELSSERKHLRPGDVLAQGWAFARKIWQTELWVIDDHPVTVSKVIIALIILVVGTIFAKRLLLRVIKRLESSTGMSKNSISIVSNAVYYFTLLVVVLFTLKTVRIPLTAFTFLGGALAIGVGFGAQNLLSNFISGFIIMMEQPIRIGDQVEVDGKVGVIKEIGARCTRVQTFENIDILVPNSVFLEKSIVNRSKADKLYRAKIAVGVAYGSDTRLVESLLNQIAREHSQVLRDPEPFVLFQAFGASTLDFELFVWLKLDDVGKVPSELRHRINEVFAEHGVEIAFNQLDVHLKG
ncbi:MAG: putative MscS family protein1 precursor [Deltaproteobacteria bacterium ADurb.Bin510]|nr:MAG: putative MscS family protein1 precursor [Deltaproteobacteria bacterium ADurb.Bin510]